MERTSLIFRRSLTLYNNIMWKKKKNVLVSSSSLPSSSSSTYYPSFSSSSTLDLLLTMIPQMTLFSLSLQEHPVLSSSPDHQHLQQYSFIHHPVSPHHPSGRELSFDSGVIPAVIPILSFLIPVHLDPPSIHSFSCLNLLVFPFHDPHHTWSVTTCHSPESAAKSIWAWASHLLFILSFDVFPQLLLLVVRWWIEMSDNVMREIRDLTSVLKQHDEIYLIGVANLFSSLSQHKISCDSILTIFSHSK